MAKKRHKDHGAKREPGGFVPLPYAVLRSPAWCLVSARAVKLLCDLLAQYRGDNNGDLCAAMKLMGPRGWRSKALLSGALKELEERQMLVRTRQGGRNRAALYAVTFYEIDWCGGKLDIQAPTKRWMGSWKNAAPPMGQSSANCPTDGAKKLTTDAHCPAGNPSQGPNFTFAAPPAGPSIDSPLPREEVQG